MARRRKQPLSASHRQALADHKAWLLSQGIEPKTGWKRLRGVPVEPYQPEARNCPPCSDTIPGYNPAPSRLLDPTFREAVDAKAKTVAPSYSKGPLQPQTSTDLFASRRRD